MRLLRFSAWRLLSIGPVLVGVVTFTFLLVRILPGDPVGTLLGPNSSAQDRIDLTARLGLDQPIYIQFFQFVSDLFRGNFGKSLQTGRPVMEELSEVFPATIELIIISLIIALIIGVTLGLTSAIRERKPSDKLIRLTSIVGNSMPEFWIGLILILIFYGWLGIVPAPSGRIDTGITVANITGMEFIDSILTFNKPAFISSGRHLFLPVLTIIFVISAPITRSVRASALEVIASDSFITAKAHGLSGWTLIRKYLVRNSLITLPTLSAIIFGFMLGSIILVETVFGWQGFGQWALKGLSLRDYPVIQLTVMTVAFFYTIAYFIADVVHSIIDPRIDI
jgi:peptide/nickel transport system permease protein